MFVKSKPCVIRPHIRGLHITVYDVLEYRDFGMSEADIPSDYPGSHLP